MGISEYSSSCVTFSIYPNPKKGNFTLEIRSVNRENYLIEITNIIGQLIYIEKIDNISGKFTKQIDMSENERGVYFLSIKNSTGFRTEKLIVY